MSLEEAQEVVRRRHAVRQSSQEIASNLEGWMSALGKLSAPSGSVASVELDDSDAQIDESTRRAEELLGRLTRTKAAIAQLEAELDKAQKFRRVLIFGGVGAVLVLGIVLLTTLS